MPGWRPTNRKRAALQFHSSDRQSRVALLIVFRVRFGAPFFLLRYEGKTGHSRDDTLDRTGGGAVGNHSGVCVVPGNERPAERPEETTGSFSSSPKGSRSASCYRAGESVHSDESSGSNFQSGQSCVKCLDCRHHLHALPRSVRDHDSPNGGIATTDSRASAGPVHFSDDRSRT